MYTTQQCIGECPTCGDELYLFKTRNHKRLIKCINIDCDDQVIYGVPKAGSVEITGLECPKSKFPLLAIIPKLRVESHKYRIQTKKTYFWSNSPCFSCSQNSQCPILEEAKDDYLEETE